jgi:hypothetical protein
MRRMLLTPWVRGLPIVFGNMSKRGVPDEMIRAWMEPLGQAEIRRDVRRYAGGAMSARKDMLAATPALASFRGPVLIAWGAEDKLMPIEHAHRLASDFPNARLVVIPGSYTLVPWDQPEALAAELRELVSACRRVHLCGTAGAGGGGQRRDGRALQPCDGGAGRPLTAARVARRHARVEELHGKRHPPRSLGGGTAPVRAKGQRAN